MMAYLYWLKGLWRQIIRADFSDQQCPWCGEHHWGDVQPIKVLESGSYIAYGGECHYFEALIRCDCCGHEFEFSGGD